MEVGGGMDGDLVCSPERGRVAGRLLSPWANLGLAGSGMSQVSICRARFRDRPVDRRAIVRANNLIILARRSDQQWIRVDT